MSTETLTLTDFLLARIAEDEAKTPHLAGCGWAIVEYDQNECDCGMTKRWPRECEAKRRIVELHGSEQGADACDEWESWPCRTVRHLATVYADHPDYRDEWRA